MSCPIKMKTVDHCRHSTCLRYLWQFLPTPSFLLPVPPKRPEQTQIPLPLPSKSHLHPILPSSQTPLFQPPTTIVVNPCAEKKKAQMKLKRKARYKTWPYSEKIFLEYTIFYTSGKAYLEHTFPFYIYGKVFQKVYFYTFIKDVLKVNFYTSRNIFPIYISFLYSFRKAFSEYIIFFAFSEKAFSKIFFYTSKKYYFRKMPRKIKCLANTQTSWC